METKLFNKIFKYNAVPSAYWQTMKDNLLSDYCCKEIMTDKIVSIISETDKVVPFI